MLVFTSLLARAIEQRRRVDFAFMNLKNEYEDYVSSLQDVALHYFQMEDVLQPEDFIKRFEDPLSRDHLAELFQRLDITRETARAHVEGRTAEPKFMHTPAPTGSHLSPDDVEFASVVRDETGSTGHWMARAHYSKSALHPAPKVPVVTRASAHHTPPPIAPLAPFGPAIQAAVRPDDERVIFPVPTEHTADPSMIPPIATISSPVKRVPGTPAPRLAPSGSGMTSTSRVAPRRAPSTPSTPVLEQQLNTTEDFVRHHSQRRAVEEAATHGRLQQQAAQPSSFNRPLVGDGLSPAPRATLSGSGGGSSSRRVSPVAPVPALVVALPNPYADGSVPPSPTAEQPSGFTPSMQQLDADGDDAMGDVDTEVADSAV